MAKLIDITGKALSGEWGSEDDAGKGIPVLRTTNFTNEGVVKYDNVVTRTITKKNISEKYLRPGDIIIEKSGGSDKQPVGRVIYFDGPENTYLFNNFTGLLRVINQNEWLPKYVFYSLFANYRRGGTRAFENKTTGLHNLKTDDYVSRYVVKDAEYTEQVKICEHLDIVRRIIQLRKEELERLDNLIKARFVEMFGNTKYPTKALINIIKEGAGLSYGIVVPGEDYTDGVPMVRPSDFKNGALDLSNVYRVNPEIEKKYARTRLIGDEILVQVIGQPGQVMLATHECKGMNVTRNLAVIRPDNDIVNRIYLKEFIEKKESQRYLLQNTKQSTLKQLPLNLLKQLEVEMPPYEMQERFADFVNQVDKSKVAVQKSLEETQLLFDSLMQQYFG